MGRAFPAAAKEHAMVRLSALLLLAALSSAALADPVPKPGDPEYETKMICRKEAPTGSLIRTKKECRTQAQWDALARGSQDMANDLVERNRGMPPTGP
jgi:hypothetical protein